MIFWKSTFVITTGIDIPVTFSVLLHCFLYRTCQSVSIGKHLISKSQTAFSWKLVKELLAAVISSCQQTRLILPVIFWFSSDLPSPPSFQSSTLDRAWRTHPLYPDVFKQSLHPANYLIDSRFQGGTIVFWFWPIDVLTLLMAEASSSSAATVAVQQQS